MAEAAEPHQARVDFISVGPLRDPFRDVRGVVLVDSLAAAAVAPWALASRRRPGPLAAIVHQPPGGVGQGAVRTAAQQRLDMLLYRRSDLLIAVSPALAHELVERCGLPHDRICVAEPGSKMQLTPNATVDMRLGRRAAVLCVGNWFPNKGIIELLDAVSVLPADDVTLHLVGRSDVDARYSARVHDRLSSTDLANRVIVHGSVAPRDLGSLYAGADMFALASYSETYGMVYAEALAAGLPVVGWRSGNLLSLIEDQRQGCLVDPGDIAGLSRALLRLATDDTWRATLATAARRRGEMLPTWTDTADKFFGALSRLAAARG